MKQFAFRLEPVLKHRKRLKDEAQEAFFTAKNLFQDGLRELEDIKDEGRRRREDLKKDQKQGLSAHSLMLHLRYITHLNKLAKSKAEDVVTREKEADRRKEILIKASKDKRVIEKLKEKKLNGFLKELMRFEQKELDDSAVNRFIRKENGNGG